MSDIFFSYASQDRERVKPIVEALTLQGWSVWWDRKIPAGKTFDQIIEEALEAACCVVVVWSRNSVRSEWVKNEAYEALNRHILVPVLIDDVKIPLGFKRIQAARLLDWEIDQGHVEFESLVESIKNIISENRGTKQLKETEHERNQSDVLPEETRVEVKKEDNEIAEREIQTDQILDLPESLITSNVNHTQQQKKPQEQNIPRHAHDTEQPRVSKESADSSELFEEIQKILNGFTDKFLFVGKTIPPNKVNNAIKSYAPQVSPEDVLILYDNTFFRTAKDGFLLTADTIYWYRPGFDADQIRYTEILKVNWKSASSWSSSTHILINENLINEKVIFIGVGNPDKIAESLVNVIRHLTNR